MINEDLAKGKWKQLKGEIQKTWGDITGDELEQTRGDLKSIAGLIQQRYGIAKEEASQKLSELSNRFADSAAEASESVKSKVADMTEKAKEKLERPERPH